MIARIADILADKGSDVVTIGSTATTAEVVALLTRHRIGAVMVVDDADVPLGIVSERDVVHAAGRAGAEVLGLVVTEVMSADVPLGIVSERDVVQAVGRAGAEVLGTVVTEVMSSDVPACTPKARVDDVAALMTQGRHRHVPVIVGGELLGIVSVGDVVRSQIEDLSEAAEQLRAYVAGGY